MNMRRTLAVSLVALTVCMPVGGALGHDDAAWRAWAEGAGSRVEARQFSAERIRRLVALIAVEQDAVPPALALALARVESNFDAAALSPKGARGVMQIMPATARGEFGVPAEALWDPVVNIRLGLEYLAGLYALYGERWDAALSHYNGGSLPGVDARPHRFNADYVADVEAWRDHYASDPRTVSFVADLRDGLHAEPVDRRARRTGPFSAEAVRVAATLGPAPTAVPRTGYDVIAADIRSLRKRFRASLQESEALRQPAGWRPVR